MKRIKHSRGVNEVIRDTQDQLVCRYRLLLVAHQQKKAARPDSCESFVTADGNRDHNTKWKRGKRQSVKKPESRKDEQGESGEICA